MSAIRKFMRSAAVGAAEARLADMTPEKRRRKDAAWEREKYFLRLRDRFMAEVRAVLLTPPVTYHDVERAKRLCAAAERCEEWRDQAFWKGLE